MKKTIDWLALVLGLALALFGARWMWTGWDIVQAERGWASLIAGSVMLSGGLIVAMLAWTVMRLAGAPAGRREAPAQIAEPVDQPAPSLAPARPKMPAAPVLAGAGAIAATAAAGAALAHEAPPPAAPLEDEFKSELAPEGVIEPPPLPPVAPPTVGELLRMSEERVVRESHEKHFEEPEAILPPADEIPPPLDGENEASAAIEKVETVATEIVATIAPLEPPVLASPKVEPPALVEPEAVKPDLAKSDDEKPVEPLRIPEPAPAPPAAADEPVYDDWLERTAREFDRELGRDALPKGEATLPEAPPPAAPKPEPAVVGRYSSGDTNYLMFADGSIEAQTPEGIMRFGSLTELKRFVEKRN